MVLFMNNIFDEKDYVTNYIKHGFSLGSNFQRDCQIFIRWRMGQGDTKQEIEKKIYKKLSKQLKTFDKEFFSYRVEQAFKAVKRMQKKGKNIELIHIKEVSIPYATLNWFKEQDLKKNERKLLFTLYVGDIIKHKIDGYCLHLDYDKEFLKNNSNIIKSASVVKIVRTLRMAGYLHQLVSMKEGLNGVLFLDFPETEEFKETLKDDNIYTLYTNDFYNLGNKLYDIFENDKYFLETFQNAQNSPQNGLKTVVCKECGKEFKIGPKGQRDVCRECYRKIKNHVIGEEQQNIIKICKNCGKEFQSTTKGKRDICEECYRISYKEKDRLRKIPKEKVDQ